jgi:ribosome maturation factor RimP
MSVEERIREAAGRAAAERGVELVHVETARSSGRGALTVRIFIEKPEGVTHVDCAAVSHHLGTILDVEDFIPTAYTLEVSSPGLERGLYKLADYERFAGQPARLKTRRALGTQRNFRGTLRGTEGDNVVFEDRTSGEVRIPFEAIDNANLEIDVRAEFRYAEQRTREASGEA